MLVANSNYKLKLIACLTAASFLSLTLSAPVAMALPEDYSVESGDASFELADNTLTITASDQAIINFGSFSIAANETVRFLQPDSASSVLSRVTGSSSSEIFGSLFSNGELMLINPNGIHFGTTAHVEVGSLIASTLAIQSANYLSGQYLFEKEAGMDAASIFNEGSLTAADAGHIALLSESIRNTGTVTAELGSVVLGVGEKQTLSFGDGLVYLVIDRGALEGAIQNQGTLSSNGGKIILNAQMLSDTFNILINNQGILEATRVYEHDGVIELVSNGGIESTGELRADILFEEGASFKVGGEYHVGSSEINNLDNAVTLLTGNYSGTTSDAVNIIVDTDAVITLSGDTIFDADSDNNGSGAFTMNSGSSIVGAGFGLTIFTSENSTLRSITGLGNASTNGTALDLDRSYASVTPTYTMNNTISAVSGSDDWFSVREGVSLSIGSQTLSAPLFSNAGTVTGSGALNTTTQFTNQSTGTITFSGSVDSDSLFTNSGTITASGSGSWSFGGEITNNGTFDASAATGTFDADDNFTNNAGATFTSTSGSLNVGSLFSNAGTFTHNSGTVVMDGATASTYSIDSGGSSFYNLTISAANVQLTGNHLTVSNNLLNNSTTSFSATPAGFYLNGKNITVSGTFSNNGIFNLQGNETVTLTNGNDVNSGYWLYSGTNNGTADTYTIKDFGATDYYHLYIQGPSSAAVDTFTLGADVNVDGNLSVRNNKAGLDVSASNYNINVAGDWNIDGTFNARNGTVTFDGTNQTIYDTNTFYHLTKTVSASDTLTFQAGQIQTVDGTLTLQGASGNLLSLRSSVDGSYWGINPNGSKTLQYLDVKDSNNTNSTAINVAGQNVTDSGHNLNWVFVNPASSTTQTTQAESAAQTSSQETETQSSAVTDSGGTYESPSTETAVSPAVDEKLADMEGLSDADKEVLAQFMDENSTDVVLSEDGSVAYVANSSNDTVKVVDLKKKAVVGIIATGTGPASLLLAQGGKAMFVFNQWDHSVLKINVLTGEKEAMIKVGNPHDTPGIPASKEYVELLMNDGLMNQFLKEAPFPESITANNGKTVFFLNKATDTIAIINADSGKTQATLAANAKSGSPGFPINQTSVQLLMNDGLMAEFLK